MKIFKNNLEESDEWERTWFVYSLVFWLKQTNTKESHIKLIYGQKVEIIVFYEMENFMKVTLKVHFKCLQNFSATKTNFIDRIASVRKVSITNILSVIPDNYNYGDKEI